MRWCCFGEKISHICSRMHPVACEKWSVYLANMETCGNFIDRFQSAERPLKGPSTKAEQAWTTHETVERKKNVGYIWGVFETWCGRYPVWRRKRLTCLHGRRSDISDAESINGDEIPEPPRRNSPSDPTSREIEDHVLTRHANFRSWCAACVQGRGRADGHRGEGHNELEDGSKITRRGITVSLRPRIEPMRFKVEQRGDSPVLVCTMESPSQFLLN